MMISRMRPQSMSPADEIRYRQRALGVKLRYLFEPVVSQPIPDEWVEILRSADERQAAALKADK